MSYVQCGYMVNWSKMRCRQGQATRRKRFKFVTLNIYCFYTFKNIRECQRGNAPKAIDRCSTAIASRDLSRLRTSRAIMLCGKELVNAWIRTEMHLFCVYIGIPQLHTLVWCDQFPWTQQKPNDVIYNRYTSWFGIFHCNSDTYQSTWFMYNNK